MMPPGQDGPDGSSLKPVSSLRSHFESMGKTALDLPSGGPSPRPLSPAPKLDKPNNVPDTNPYPHSTRPAIPAEKPAHLNLKGLGPGLGSGPVDNGPVPRIPTRPVQPSPSLAPKPQRPPPPPSVQVQPPHSPPKSHPSFFPSSDQTAFLNPDSLVTPTTPSSSPRHFRIPSRPHTPSLDPGKSQRSPVSNPPSPPPPRRSGEFRRDREQKTQPPPVNRAEKPSLLPARSATVRESRRQPEPPQSRIHNETSPFSSPPGSGGSSGEEEAPPIPTRPRPVVNVQRLSRAFEAPPALPSPIGRREEGRAVNGIARGQITPQVTGERKPALPARPQLSSEPPPRPPSFNITTKPPPRPTRPAATRSHTTLEGGASPAQPKRTSTMPVTHHPPPPQRITARALPVAERPIERAAPEHRPAPTTAMAIIPFVGHQDSPPKADQVVPITAFPDTSNTNRRPPYIKQGVYEVHTKYDARIFDVCGEYVCSVGHLTRVWSLLDGEQVLSLSHGEGVRASAVSFKPAAHAKDEGKRLWIGNNIGEVMEVDIATQSVVLSQPTIHSRQEVTKIYRHANELWTLDDAGTLHIWGPSEDDTPSLRHGPHHSYRLQKGHTFSMVIGEHLWFATGKDIRIYAPSPEGNVQFQVRTRPLYQEGAGEVSAGTLVDSQPDKVFFGHTDGKVSIYSITDQSCLGILSISTYKINTLAGVNGHIWAGYSTGRVCVYDIAKTPWAVKKDWLAHENPVLKLIADPASVYQLDRYQVVSLGADNMIRAWDGFLQDDWLEEEMKVAEVKYCQFDKIKAMIMTWNAGASTPHSLRYSESDDAFLRDLLQSSECPDIIVFGFQELVDLEDKTATAKRFLKKKKKEGADQERMSHQYRDWRDFLLKSLDDYMPPDNLYHLLHTAHLVGLFTCIFVKSTLRDRIRNLQSSEVKRGMGGYHGNKGATVVRFMIDDTSLCFVNCHLAAGQSQAAHRHTDIAAILDSALFPVERDPGSRIDRFVGGGDGSMILDHELCLLNGDLNYRIDTMSRDTVVTAVKSGNLGKLLERDQLLVARRRIPGFRLRAFEEMPITFAPTYKYDVGTDNYDSSEKKRSPAWCDRILYRGRGRIQQLGYARHEVRVSDHRPVSGKFRFKIKRIDQERRAAVWIECLQRFEALYQQEAEKARLAYLMTVCGYDQETSRHLLQEKKASRREGRSRSRPR